LIAGVNVSGKSGAHVAVACGVHATPSSTGSTSMMRKGRQQPTLSRAITDRPVNQHRRFLFFE
jgi:hypothetical protein